MFKLYNIVCKAVVGKLHHSQIPVSPALATIDASIHTHSRPLVPSAEETKLCSTMVSTNAI